MRRAGVVAQGRTHPVFPQSASGTIVLRFTCLWSWLNRATQRSATLSDLRRARARNAWGEEFCEEQMCAVRGIVFHIALHDRTRSSDTYVSSCRLDIRQEILAGSLPPHFKTRRLRSRHSEGVLQNHGLRSDRILQCEAPGSVLVWRESSSCGGAVIPVWWRRAREIGRYPKAWSRALEKRVGRAVLWYGNVRLMLLVSSPVV